MLRLYIDFPSRLDYRASALSSESDGKLYLRTMRNAV
jgi:hypothetical protein